MISISIYRPFYFDLTDTVLYCAENWFTQTEYYAWRNIEQVPLNCASQLIYETKLSDVVGVYSDEINHYWLSKKLQLLRTKLIESYEKNISGIINFMKQCFAIQSEFFSEIAMLLTL